MAMSITNNLSMFQTHQTSRGLGNTMQDLQGMNSREGGLLSGAAQDEETLMKAGGDTETIAKAQTVQDRLTRVDLPVAQVPVNITNTAPLLVEYPPSGEVIPGKTTGGFSGGATTNFLDLENGVKVETSTVKDENGTTSTTSVTDSEGKNMTKTTVTDKNGKTSSDTVKKDAQGNVVAADEPIIGEGDGDAGFFDPGYIPGRGFGDTADGNYTVPRRYIRPGDAWINPPKVILSNGNELATQVSYLDSAIQNVKGSAGSENSRNIGQAFNGLAKSIGSLGTTNQASLRGISRNDTARSQAVIGGISNLANNGAALQKGANFNLLG
ncbi:MAG: hypothetical protein GY757_12755 [bacterium]|nr:hypothetical protein [bacterium]